MIDTSIVRPLMTVLSEEQKKYIHEKSVKILTDVGIRVDSEKARLIFSSSDGVTVDGDKVYLSQELIAWAIHSAPEKIEIYNRDGIKSFCLGEDSTRFGIGTTNLFYQEPGSNQIVPFLRKHMGLGARLGNTLEAYDLVSTIGILKDIQAGTEDLYGTLEMAANTSKALVLLISDPAQFKPCINMLENLFGDLCKKPFVITHFNPVTPLVINKDTCEKMIEAIDHGLPIIYSNYSMAGTTSPINPAGTLSLLIAELLAGLVLAQLVKEGTPIILGSLPAFFDMKTMVDFYDPLTILLNAACAEMMAFYKIPHAGTSGSGNGWGMDLPASGMLWMNHLTACMGKTGLSPFVGGSLGSKAFSPETVVYANDIINQTRRFANGFVLDDESFGLEEIASMGPGANFLFSPTTRRNFRDSYFQSKLFPNISLEKWIDIGQPKSEDKLTERTMQLIAETNPPDDSLDIIKKGEAIISRLH